MFMECTPRANLCQAMGVTGLFKADKEALHRHAPQDKSFCPAPDPAVLVLENL